MALSGWSHTRNYARGFLKNNGGLGYATVSGLEPGGLYAWRIVQAVSAVAKCHVFWVWFIDHTISFPFI